MPLSPEAAPFVDAANRIDKEGARNAAQTEIVQASTDIQTAVNKLKRTQTFGLNATVARPDLDIADPTTGKTKRQHIDEALLAVSRVSESANQWVKDNYDATTGIFDRRIVEQAIARARTNPGVSAQDNYNTVLAEMFDQSVGARQFYKEYAKAAEGILGKDWEAEKTKNAQTKADQIVAFRDDFITDPVKLFKDIDDALASGTELTKPARRSDGTVVNVTLSKDQAVALVKTGLIDLPHAVRSGDGKQVVTIGTEEIVVDYPHERWSNEPNPMDKLKDVIWETAAGETEDELYRELMELKNEDAAYQIYLKTLDASNQRTVTPGMTPAPGSPTSPPAGGVTPPTTPPAGGATPTAPPPVTPSPAVPPPETVVEIPTDLDRKLSEAKTNMDNARDAYIAAKKQSRSVFKAIVAKFTGEPPDEALAEKAKVYREAKTSYVTLKATKELQAKPGVKKEITQTDIANWKDAIKQKLDTTTKRTELKDKLADPAQLEQLLASGELTQGQVDAINSANLVDIANDADVAAQVDVLTADGLKKDIESAFKQELAATQVEALIAERTEFETAEFNAKGKEARAKLLAKFILTNKWIRFGVGAALIVGSAGALPVPIVAGLLAHRTIGEFLGYSAIGEKGSQMIYDQFGKAKKDDALGNFSEAYEQRLLKLKGDKKVSQKEAAAKQAYFDSLKAELSGQALDARFDLKNLDNLANFVSEVLSQDKVNLESSDDKKLLRLVKIRGLSQATGAAIGALMAFAPVGENVTSWITSKIGLDQLLPKGEIPTDVINYTREGSLRGLAQTKIAEAITGQTFTDPGDPKMLEVLAKLRQTPGAEESAIKAYIDSYRQLNLGSAGDRLFGVSKGLSRKGFRELLKAMGFIKQI